MCVDVTVANRFSDTIPMGYGSFEPKICEDDFVGGTYTIQLE